MTEHDRPRDARLLAGRERLMDVLSTGAIFSGDVEGLRRDDFRACLHELLG